MGTARRQRMLPCGHADSAAGLSGDTGLFGLPTVHLDMDFGDILKDLDFAAMAIAEARYDRYSIFADVMYTKISSGHGTPRGIVAGSVDVSSETFAGLIGAGYLVLQNDRGNLDLVAGARIWHASTDISFSGGILDGVERSDGATWVDALAGVRAKYSITDKVYFTGWGLIGGGVPMLTGMSPAASATVSTRKYRLSRATGCSAWTIAMTVSSSTSSSRDRSSASSCIFESCRGHRLWPHERLGCTPETGFGCSNGSLVAAGSYRQST